METSIIRASVCPDPFSTTRLDVQVPEGASISEMMDVYAPRGMAGNAHVFIDGELIERPLWASCVPKAGQNVVVRVIPEGGQNGKDALRIVFAISAIAMSFWNPAGALIYAKAGMISGMALGTALLGQVPMPTAPQADPRRELYSLTGQSNQINLYGPIPKVYGRMKIYPPLAARPFTEIAGDNQYLRLLYCAGYAPLTLSEFKIGDDPLEYYNDVQIETGTSVDDGTPVPTLYSNSVYETSLNDELVPADYLIYILYDNEVGGNFAADETLTGGTSGATATILSVVDWGGNGILYLENVVGEFLDNEEITDSDVGVADADGGTVTEYIGYVTHTTDYGVDADEISLDFTFPAGLVRFDDNNDKHNASVDLQVQYREANQKYILYDNETSAFAVDETLTGASSQSYGKILEVVDNGTEGALLVRVDSGVFSDGETITDSQETPGAATVNGTAGTHYLLYDNEASGPFVLGTVLIGGTSGAHATIVGLQDDGATGVLALTNVTQKFLNDEEITGDGSTTADANGDSVEPSWLSKDAPNGDDVCPDFNDDHWSGLFSEAAGEVHITSPLGIPGYIEGPNGTYVIGAGWIPDTIIPIHGADNFTLELKFKAADASDYYTPLAGYYVTIKYMKGPIESLGLAENKDGDTSTTITGSYAADSAYHTITYNGTAGPLVEYLKLKIRARSPYTPDEFYVKEPVVTLSNIYEITAKTTNAVRKNIIIKPTTPGQYDVRVARTNVLGTGNTIDTVYWTALRAIEHVSPINKAGLKFIALRIRANGQLNGNIDQFSCVASSNLPVYDGATWADTDDVANPAWVFCDILKGAATRHPLADARLDLTAIRTWAGYCSGIGETDLREFNAVIDERVSVLELLGKVAAVGRASFCFKDGLYSIVEDRAKTTVVQSFTPRNSWGFSGQKTFYERPHALKMRFINADADYIQDEIIVYDDGYDSTNATVFESIDTWGITDPEQVWEAGRYHIGCMRMRPEIMTLNADAENIACTRGDLVRINHDVPMWGLGFARVKTKEHVGSDTTFTIDDAWLMEDGKRYTIRIRFATGLYSWINPETIIGLNSSFTVPDALSSFYNALTVGDLCMFGIQNIESALCLVHSIRRGPDLTAQMSFVEYNPACYDTGTFPAFDSKITVPSETHRTPPVPVIYQMRSDETVLYRATDGTLVSSILIELIRQSTSEIAPQWLQVEYREYDTAQPWEQLKNVSSDTMSFSIYGVEDGLTYSIRMRYISAYGRASAWNETTHTVIGKTSAPADIETFLMKQPSTLYWVYDPPLDIDGYYVRYNYGENSNWEAGTPAHSGVLKVAFLDIGAFYGGTTTFMVKAVDTSGNESENAAVLIRDMGEPDPGNIVGIIDYQADGFGGEIVNGTISGVDLVADSDASLFYGADAEAFYGADGDLFYGSRYLEMSYTFPFVPDSQDAGVDIWLDYTVVELRDVYYRVTEAYFDDEFTGALTDNWETPTAGTWTIVSEELEVTHDHAGAYNQTMECKIDRPANGTKHYVSLRVKAEDISESRFGVKISGQFFMYDLTKYTMSVDGDTPSNPAWADDTWQYWLFEVLDDDTINWYVDGAFIGTGTLQDTTINLLLLAADPNTAGKKYYFDEVKMYEPTTDFAAWPGKIATAANSAYELRIRTLNGYAQGQITNLDLNVDYEDITEHIEDLAVADSGTVYLPIVKTYRSIVNVLLTIQDSGAETAVSSKVIEKNPGGGNGPVVETYDAAGDRAAGHIDAKVKGY